MSDFTNYSEKNTEALQKISNVQEKMQQLYNQKQYAEMIEHSDRVLAELHVEQFGHAVASAPSITFGSDEYMLIKTLADIYFFRGLAFKKDNRPHNALDGFKKAVEGNIPYHLQTLEMYFELRNTIPWWK